MSLIFSCGNDLEKELTFKMVLEDGYTGKGTLSIPEWKYVGEWKGGDQHGQGTLTYKNGFK